MWTGRSRLHLTPSRSMSPLSIRSSPGVGYTNFFGVSRLSSPGSAFSKSHGAFQRPRNVWTFCRTLSLSLRHVSRFSCFGRRRGSWKGISMHPYFWWASYPEVLGRIFTQSTGNSMWTRDSPILLKAHLSMMICGSAVIFQLPTTLTLFLDRGAKIA